MIFADSSYFIAISDRKDQWHERAIELSRKAHSEIVVTDLILSESVTAVGARGGGKAGMALYEHISDNCDVVFVTKDTFEKAMQVFLKYDGTPFGCRRCHCAGDEVRGHQKHTFL